MKYLLLILISITSSFCFGQYSGTEPCDDVTETIDKFTGDTTYRTPLINPISYTMLKPAKGESMIFLRLEAIGSTAMYGKKGVIILLSDSTKMNFPDVDIDVNYSYGTYSYSAFIAISEEDLLRLSKNEITDFRLYVFDKTVKPKNRKYYMQLAGCMNKKV